MGQFAQGMTWEGTEALRDGAAATRQEQFTALVHRQASFLFRVTFAVLRNVQDAEDAVQETFLKLYRQANFQQLRDERAYLARIACRVAVTRRKHQSVPIEASSEQPSTEPNPEEVSASSDWDACVQRLIHSLPEELRDPLLLSAIEELASNEIAEVLSIPEGTVRNRLFRARQILKQKMSSLKVRDGK